jgi:Dullard-like phosphatase family protein
MNNIPEVKNLDNLDNLLPKKSCDKKTLVLDLDETLVHSQFQPFEVPSDITLKIELEDELHDIHVMVRPGVKEFLENMGKIYEIVIFTASVSKYADPLLDIIDKEKNCKFRLFREHCTPINTCFVKEIKRLGRQLKDIVIVDNSPMSYALNPENGLPISTWFDDKEDRELYNISSILEFLSFVPDVRNYIHQFVVNDEISYNNVINVFDRYNEMLNQKKINKNNINKNKSKDNKKLFNKNSSKTKINNNHLISENKENVSNNILIKNNNNYTRFKKNITFSNIKTKNEKDIVDIKINLNLNKKVRPDSKNNNKSKENNLNTKNIIYNIENSENINPNILNFNNLNKLNNIITDIQNLNQTTKNKNTKSFIFNPNSIITNITNSPISNINLIPNTTTHKNSFCSLNNKTNNFNTTNNNKLKNNNKIIKHRKSDSTNGLYLPKKIYENNGTNNNKINHFQHSNSIILNKKKKIINNSNIIGNSNNNLNLTNFTNNAQTTKNKNNKDFQISMRLNRDIGQELNKLEVSEEQDNNANKKLSKSLTKEKISVSFSSKNKTSNNNNYSNNTFCNKSSLIKTSKTNENSNYIYHKKHKSINTSFIPFPSTTKNKDNKLLNKKYNIDTNKINKNSINKYNPNNSNNNINKHKRFLSTSESYTSNYLNNIYTSNISNTNNSTIIGTNSLNTGNTNNIFLNNLSYKNRQRNSQRKMNNLADINCMKTERNKENYNTNYDKKKENKIPFNLIKKRNSLNENTLKKKIPSGNGNKNLMVNLISNESKNLGYHKKNISYNPEISGIFSVRPKSTKQIMHLKNSNNISNYKVEVNISSHLEYNKKNKDNLNISKRNINNKTKQI